MEILCFRYYKSTIIAA